MTSISIVERLAGLAQTVLIARVLGITEYGVYGLIFGTIGLTASIAAVQMGFTATVFVSRYRDTEKDKAAYVISFVNRFSLAVSLVFLLVTIPFAPILSQWLIGAPGSQWAVTAGCLLVALSIMGGVQDGVIQGFEDFRSIALVRLATTLISLICIYSVGRQFGLSGVMVAMLLGPVFKYMLLIRTLNRHVRLSQLPAHGSGLSGKDLLWGFSIPSMLASLLSGVAGWIGTFLLSRQANGFDALAIVNTGLQWRGPIFLVTTAISSVAIPAISRNYHSANHVAVHELQKSALFISGFGTLIVASILIMAAPSILSAYGAGFSGGALIFSLVVSSALPQVISNILIQELMAEGRMWIVFLMQLFLVIPMYIGFVCFVPAYLGVGYGVVNLSSWISYLMGIIILKKYRLALGR